jgi:hypothetical protein
LTSAEKLKELEIRLQRLRSPPARVPRAVTQRRTEVGVGVGRLHLPQRPPEPGTHLLQVDHIRADRGIGQPGRCPGEHETGQHVGLEIRQLLRSGRRPRLAQVADHCQAQPVPPPVQSDRTTITGDDMTSRSLKNDQHADAGSPKDQNAKAQAETPAHHPTKQDGEPAGDLTRDLPMTDPRPPRAARPRQRPPGP